MWILYALLSAIFAGITSILAKEGIRETDSAVATFLRTIVVLVFSSLMVLVAGSGRTLFSVQPRTLLFLILSGAATGASWLCYFKALSMGDVNKVAAIDKSSTALTIILSFLVLGEGFSIYGGAALALIGCGSILMVEKKDVRQKGNEGRGWLFYALFSALFASLTAILGKIGISGVESNLGTAIRTLVVLASSYIMVVVTGKKDKLRDIGKRDLGFIVLSGLATGASWLCYYRALQSGRTSVVVSMDKLSILVTVAFSALVLKERISRRAILALLMITFGTFILVLPSL